MLHQKSKVFQVNEKTTGIAYMLTKALIELYVQAS